MNKWSLYVGKIFGIKVFIHWTFIFLIAWILVNNFREGNTIANGVYTIAFVLAVFGCVTLHELGHALAAKYFKYHTKDITILPIGGMARMDEIPENPNHELAVAFAGPMVNILIAIFLYPLVVWFGSIPTFFSILFNSGDTFIFSLLVVNIILATFNLIPAFPMDGGRAFRAVLSFFMDRVRATRIAARTGQVLAVAFFFIGILYNPILALIGVFIFMMAQAENDLVKSRSILHDYTVRDVMMQKFYSLDVFDTIDDAVKGLLDVEATNFLVMEKGHVVGTLSRNAIIHALAEKGKESPVVFAMNTKIISLTPDLALDKIFSLFTQTGSSILPVFKGNILIGVVDMDNILELIMVKTAIENKSRKYHQKIKAKEPMLQRA